MELLLEQALLITATIADKRLIGTVSFEKGARMELLEILEELEKVEHDQRCKAICEGRKERQIIEKRKLMALREAINLLAAL